MEGKEHMIRNEIAVLRRISVGHANILTLADYFETLNNCKFVFWHWKRRLLVDDQEKSKGGGHDSRNLLLLGDNRAMDKDPWSRQPD